MLKCPYCRSVRIKQVLGINLTDICFIGTMIQANFQARSNGEKSHIKIYVLSLLFQTCARVKGKCPLSVLTDVHIKRANVRENIPGAPNEKI